MESARLVRKHGLLLGLCFVIGLPEDNIERHRYSVRLAKSLKPDYIFWNMCTPWPGTEIHKWYKSHGEIYDVRNFSTLIDQNAVFEFPPCSSSDFSSRDRIKAWLSANMETHNYFQSLRAFLRLISLTFKYKTYRSLAVYLVKYLPGNLLRYPLRWFGRMLR